MIDKKIYKMLLLIHGIKNLFILPVIVKIMFNCLGVGMDGQMDGKWMLKEIWVFRFVWLYLMELISINTKLMDNGLQIPKNVLIIMEIIQSR
jgi:hypothetical protein